MNQSSKQPAMAIESGLCIKLQISKIEGRKETKMIEQQNFLRVCSVCSKGFASGKALGGHMRMHFQDSKNEAKRSRENSHSKSNNPTCYSCGKKFPSMKSLFGHMRSHPERQWRGIQPPRAVLGWSSSSTVTDVLPQTFDDQIDSTAETVLAGWFKKRRSINCSRGGSASDTGSSPGGSTAEQRMQEAVSDLMLLADHASNFPPEKNSKVDIETSETEDEEGETMLRIRKRKRKMKSIQLEVGMNEQIASVSSYECSLCGKKFPNHQALGGHRSSHNKSKMKIADNAAQMKSETGIIIPAHGGSIAAVAASSGDGAVEAESSTQITNSAEQLSQLSNHRAMNIDLNELPAMEDEEYAEWCLFLH